MIFAKLLMQRTSEILASYFAERSRPFGASRTIRDRTVSRVGAASSRRARAAHRTPRHRSRARARARARARRSTSVERVARMRLKDRVARAERRRRGVVVKVER